MNKQRLYENIMRDLRDVFSSLMNEDVLDDLDRISSGKTSVEKILDMNPIVVRQGGKYIEMQLSDDENKNEIMRLVANRFCYITGDEPDDVLYIDDFLFRDSDGEYKMYLRVGSDDLMNRRWVKGRIFAYTLTKDLKTPKWICFNKEDDGKWYAVYRERDAWGGHYRILNIRQ